MKSDASIQGSSENCEKSLVQNFSKTEKFPAEKTEFESTIFKRKQEKINSASTESESKQNLERKEKTEVKEKVFPTEKTLSQTSDKERFHWKAALIQSGIFLGIQHGYRTTQKRTRESLGGPFFRDWAQSIKGLRGFNDSDGFFVNDILHPLQGGLTGRIFVNNSDCAKKQEFGKSKEYWKSRFKTMIWSTVWSTQFELGPVSEASFGNVGRLVRNGRPTTAYGDLVITPTLGTGVVIGEDAIDKYVLKNWLERKSGKATTKIKILRIVLTPTTSFANILRGKVPWRRDFRFN